METKASFRAKDNVVNIYFALLNKLLDSTEKREIHIKELESVLCRISDFARMDPKISKVVYQYEEPDLTYATLKKNEYIKEINDDIVSFEMSLEDSEKIIKRNEIMAVIISDICAAESFGEDLSEMTNGQLKFNYNNPNVTYLLRNEDYFDYKDYNELFTDGDIKVIRKSDTDQTVEVRNATYTLIACISSEEGYGAVLTSLRIIPPEEKFLEEEAKLFWNGKNRLNYKEEGKHLYKVRKS